MLMKLFVAYNLCLSQIFFHIICFGMKKRALEILMRALVTLNL